MKILFIINTFQPEQNPLGLPFAKALQEQGHEVQVLTGFPNYPGGKIYDGYKVKFIQREVMEDVSVIRVPLYPSHDRSSIKRILSYTSSALSQATIGPFAVDKADVAYVCQGPATIGWPAIIHKWVRRIPFVYSIQDLWPDTLKSTGMFNSKIGYKMVDCWCKFIYKQAAKIIVIAPGMKKKLIERGVPEGKIEVVYNWCDDSIICRDDRNEQLAESLSMSNRFNIVFAGNMGKAQAIDKVIEAAIILEKEYPDIQFVFIGGGIEVNNLKEMVRNHEINNVIFHGRKPMNEIGPILRLADVLLVHLRDEKLFRITIPSKTQAYMAVGRPVLIGVPGDASHLIEQAEAGFACEPENPQSIAMKAKEFFLTDKTKLEKMGQNAMKFYDNNLSFKTAIEKHIKIFEEIR